MTNSVARFFDRSRRDLAREELAGTALLIFLLVGFPIGLASSAKLFSDGDVSWHIATGQWILQHGAIPSADPFSFTAAGRRWIAMEWLGDLVYATAFRLGSYAGIAAVASAALIALQTIVFLHIRRSVGVIGIAIAIASMDAVLGAFLIARPHLLVWPILAAWTVLLLRSLETGRIPPLWSVILLVLWTNIHASFPLAMLIAGAIALDSLIEAKWKTLPQWAGFLALSLAALFVNANGIGGVLQPFRVASLNMLPAIAEWQPSSPSLTPQFYAVLLIGMGVLLWRRVKLPIGQLLLLLTLLALAFQQLRQQEWFVIVAALVLPAHLRSTGWSQSSIKPLIPLLIAGIVIRALVPLTPPESEANPRRLIAEVPPQLRQQPVLNGYTFGGPLILAGIRPYIDGRADMYGDAFFADYKAITEGDLDRFNRAVVRYGIEWTILPTSDALLIRAIESSGSWKRLYADRIGVIDVRTAPSAGSSRASHDAAGSSP